MLFLIHIQVSYGCQLLNASIQANTHVVHQKNICALHFTLFFSQLCKSKIKEIFTHFYQSQKSSSYVGLNQNYSFEYLNGLKISGELIVDNVGLGEFNVSSLLFCEATYVSNPSPSAVPTFDVSFLNSF